jgi:excisionase family DNA binding protein
LDQFLTIDQAAYRLAMSPWYVRRLIAERRIAFHRYGRSVRLALADVEAFADTNRIEPMDLPETTRVRRAAA